MKTICISTAVLLTLLVGSCARRSQASLPACIQARIDSIRQQPKWNPPATVDEYIYNGKHVFLFSAPCCDRYNEAVDADCKYVCAPSGGYTGKGDNQCADFKEAAQFVRQVWKDNR